MVSVIHIKTSFIRLGYTLNEENYIIRQVVVYGRINWKPMSGQATFGWRSCFVWPAKSLCAVDFLMERHT